MAQIVGAVGGAISSAVGGAVSSLTGDIFGSFVNDVASTFNSILQAFETAVSFITDLIKGLIEDCLSFIEDQIIGGETITPNNARKRIKEIIANAFTLIVPIMLVAAVTSVIPFLSGHFFTDIQGMLRRMIGLESMIGAFVGANVATAFEAPLKMAANQKFRPNEVPLNDAFSMYYKGIITADRLTEVLEFNGFSDDRIENLIADSKQEIDAGTLFRIARVGNLSRQQISGYLQAQGYVDKENAILTDTILKQIIYAEQNRFLGSLISIYRDGLFTDAQFTAQLDNLGFDVDEKSLLLSDVQNEFAMSLTNLKVTALQLAFRQNTITADEMGTFLSALNIRPEKVNVLVLEELARKGMVSPELLAFASIYQDAGSPDTITYSITLVP